MTPPRCISHLTRPGLGALLVALSPLACGNNAAELPPELLDAIRNQGSGQDGNYPEGPYGTMVHDTVKNLCFDGWMDPAAAGYDPSKFQQICLADFYDPTGETVQVLLLNAGAVWCTACKIEYQGGQGRPSLAKNFELRRDRGFRVLGTIFQDAKNNPATPMDASLWAKTFELDFPFAIDPDFKLGAFTSPSQAPFNMLIDARSMEIIQQLEGDQPALLFTTVDTLLEKRAAE